jgi:hypothetical protein
MRLRHALCWPACRRGAAICREVYLNSVVGVINGNGKVNNERIWWSRGVSSGLGGVKVVIIDQLYDDLFHNLDMERSDQDSSILRQRQL